MREKNSLSIYFKNNGSNLVKKLLSLKFEFDRISETSYFTRFKGIIFKKIYVVI